MSRQWRLDYVARRQAGSPGTETSLMSGGGRTTFTQTSDAAFTIECVDILLGDHTVEEITLTPVGDREPEVAFNRDNGVPVPA